MLQNPTLFKGCNCVKSRCIKAYCECYAAGRACAGICCCKDCANEHGVRPAHPAVPVPDADLASLAAPLASLSQSASAAAAQPLAMPPPLAPLAASRALVSTSTLVRAPHGTTAAAESDGESAAPAGLRRGPRTAATAALDKRQNLDDLIAAAEVVEASELPASALHQLLSPGWAHMRPGAAELHVQCDGPPQRPAAPPPPPLPTPWHAERAGLAQSAPKRLRRATCDEAATAPPQTCFLLPAGTPVDNAMRYSVAPCGVDPAAEYSGATVQLQHGSGSYAVPRVQISGAAPHVSTDALAANLGSDESVRDACARLAASPPRALAGRSSGALAPVDADADACALACGHELGYLMAPEGRADDPRQRQFYRPVPVEVSAEEGRPRRPGSVLLVPQQAMTRAGALVVACWLRERQGHCCAVLRSDRVQLS